MQLTELQKTCWQNVGHDSAATQNIRNRALQYYLQYRQHLKQTHCFIETENKIQNLFLISFFISEKSEVVYGINGQKINNIAFSINQLVKKHTDYKQFFFHLKQMLRKITLPEETNQTKTQINAFMKYFSFVMTFYNKFLSTFEKITICHNIHQKDLQLVGGERQYKDKIKYLLWLLFISFRKIVLKNNMDTIGNTCLMACLFTYFSTQIYKMQRVISLYAPDIVEDLGTLPNIFNQIQQQLLRFFCLKDIKTYQQIRNSFMQFMSHLSTKQVQIKQPFSIKYISINIKKLQQVYHKTIQMNYIDETLFLKNLVTNQQNIRFTAFGAKRKIGKYHNHNSMLHCKRVLNYDSDIKDTQTTTSTKYRNQIPNQLDNHKTNEKNFLNVIHKVKISQTPVILIQATPINQFANAYNWLFNKSNNMKQNQESLRQLNIEDLLEVGYKDDRYQLDNQQILQKKNLIEGIFHELIDQYENDTQNQEQNINVCAILALEVFYYVMNITNRDLNELVQFLNVSWYSLWQGIDKLLNYDKNMPNNVKTHLLLLQTTIITTYIWRQQQFIKSIDAQDISEIYKPFFYRVLHHLAYQIHFIGKQLQISDLIIDQVFILCQYYLKQMSFLMKNMNLDAIILCSFYGVCRAKNLDVKFKQIMSVYKAVNNIDQRAFQLIQTVENEKGDPTNIIVYYNTVFLKCSKSILIKIKEQQLQNDELINSTNYMLSPVKSILPSELVNRSNVQGTPNQSQMLFAYNESPLLKKNKKFNTNTKKSFLGKQNHLQLNQTSTTKYYYEQNILRERSGSNNISEMIQKKFGNSKTTSLITKGNYLMRQT